MTATKLHISTSSLPPIGARDINIVFGITCLSKNIVQDTLAVIKNTSIGGELKTYTQLMENGIQEAMLRMKQSAIEIGADGIYGVNIATPHVTAGAAEIIVFGTAYSMSGIK